MTKYTMKNVEGEPMGGHLRYTRPRTSFFSHKYFENQLCPHDTYGISV